MITQKQCTGSLSGEGTLYSPPHLPIGERPLGVPSRRWHTGVRKSMGVNVIIFGARRCKLRYARRDPATRRLSKTMCSSFKKMSGERGLQPSISVSIDLFPILGVLLGSRAPKSLRHGKKIRAQSYGKRSIETHNSQGRVRGRYCDNVCRIECDRAE